MTWRAFLLGLLLGLLLAPTSGKQLWNGLRDTLVMLIDGALRLGLPPEGQNAARD